MIFGIELDPQTIITSVSPVLGRVILIVIIALITQRIASKTIHQTLKIATDRSKGEDKEEFKQRIDTVTSVFSATVGMTIWGIAGFIVISELGINIAPILTGAGVIGLAVGFGAQNLVRDMISGLFILIENQYAKGDVVRIGGLEGLVEEVNLRRTVLRDIDGIVHSIPNGGIKTASNLTQEFSKINLNLLVDGAKATEAMTQIINKVGESLNRKEPFSKYIDESPHVLRVEEIAKEGLVLKIVCTTKPIRQWEVLGELRKRLKEAFDQENISISERKS